MSKEKSQEVEDYILKLESSTRKVVQRLREIFLNSSEEIAEHIKWNSPSFYFNGKMKEFDPKEYKRDLAVINLHRGKILIVFPTGSKIDPKIALKGKDYPDGRKIVEIESLGDVIQKEELLNKAVENWIAQMDR